MKSITRPAALGGSEWSLVVRSRVAKVFNPPLSNIEIIEFQSVFMVPSVHYITTKNVASGRYLINLFLSVFQQYHNVGCLTVEQNQTLSTRAFDFYNLSQEGTSLIDSLELFCIENPILHFIWIELTQALQKKISQKEIKKICEIFCSNEQTPVLVVSYEDAV